MSGPRREVQASLVAAMSRLKSGSTAISIMDTEADISCAAAEIAQNPEDLERIQVSAMDLLCVLCIRDVARF